MDAATAEKPPHPFGRVCVRSDRRGGWRSAGGLVERAGNTLVDVVCLVESLSMVAEPCRHLWLAGATRYRAGKPFLVPGDLVVGRLDGCYRLGNLRG